MRPGALRAVILASLLPACAGNPPPPPPPTAAAHEPIPVEEGVLRLAGSGGASPLAIALGRAFASEPAGASLRVVVEDSIGSGGGVRAAADGAVDIGLVSRNLGAAETALGLVSIPAATDAVLIAAHPDVAADGLTTRELCALHRGEAHRFQGGAPAIVLLRDRSESANAALDAALPCMAAARDRSYALGYRVLYHDDAMAAALALTPGAIGVYSLSLLGASRVPLKVLSIDGRRPSVDAIAHGEWTITRPIAFVLRPDRAWRAKPFLDFAASPAGRRVAVRAGYLPAGGVPPNGNAGTQAPTAAPAGGWPAR